jgi:hypothetical protein
MKKASQRFVEKTYDIRDGSSFFLSPHASYLEVVENLLQTKTNKELIRATQDRHEGLQLNAEVVDGPDGQEFMLRVVGLQLIPRLTRTFVWEKSSKNKEVMIFCCECDMNRSLR